MRRDDPNPDRHSRIYMRRLVEDALKYDAQGQRAESDAALAEVSERLGDSYSEKGRFEKSATHYARARNFYHSAASIGQSQGLSPQFVERMKSGKDRTHSARNRVLEMDTETSTEGIKGHLSLMVIWLLLAVFLIFSPRITGNVVLSTGNEVTDFFGISILLIIFIIAATYLFRLKGIWKIRKS